MLYDKDIREPLFTFLDERYGKNRIIEEKQMGRSRADIVMVLENKIVGIEIKSDADTYVRLVRQVKDYDIYFDYNYVVVGATHIGTIEKQVPDYWGIIMVEKGEQDIAFCVLREACTNEKMELSRKLSILWRPELAHIQEVQELPAYKQKSKAFVIEKIIEKLSLEVLQHQISEELFERDYNQIAEKISAYRVENGRKPRRSKTRRIRNS
ncbi:sce7726 family protein [Niameybacter massiliensis]|uniref:sce7726 family protein n=1 Tax=Niameybacter massiliensis TaxID=1658108 RepID=UPI0006B57382|nr:sce7726 family protein [Niameybacter massiliensis]